MSMFGYYAFHSCVNQIRKLFKTWVAIFIAVILLVAVVIGVSAGLIVEAIEKNAPESEESEVIDESEQDDGEEEIPLSEEEISAIIELSAGGIILLVLVFTAFAADKSVSNLFLPADVPLLFASPLTPQSVLIFRLSMQLGGVVFSSIYILFQLPNLIINLGISVYDGIALVLTWFLTLAWAKIIQVFLYIFCSTQPTFKKHLSKILLGILGLIGLSFYGYYRLSGTELFPAAVAFFNGKFSCVIPVWGWLKAIVMFGTRHAYLWQGITAVGNIAAMALALFGIWHMKSDYYEEAMTRCDEITTVTEAAKEGKTIRKKARSDKLRRENFCRGFGADVYFWKAMYNRFRFAYLKFFTKTSVTYLTIGLLMSLAFRFLFRLDTPIPIFATLAVFSFFRSLGNPLEEDTAMDYFILIPESLYAKLFYSLLGGLTNCALDLLPGILFTGIIMGTDFLTVLLWFFLILSLNYYSTCVGAFIDFSVPTSAGVPIRALVQIMFVYFGMLPDIVLVVLAGIFSQLWNGLLLSVIMNCAVGSIFFVISPACLWRGRK